jgi:hypothetical protein
MIVLVIRSGSGRWCLSLYLLSLSLVKRGFSLSLLILERSPGLLGKLFGFLDIVSDNYVIKNGAGLDLPEIESDICGLEVGDFVVDGWVRFMYRSRGWQFWGESMGPYKQGWGSFLASRGLCSLGWGP